MRRFVVVAASLVIAICQPLRADSPPEKPLPTDTQEAYVKTAADQWRAEHRLIDLHQHIDFSPKHLALAVKMMDKVGIGVAVCLGSGSTSPGKNGEPSEFERNKQLADKLFPGRFMFYMTLDFRGWDEEDWPHRAVKQIEEGHRLGAAGLKEFKRLGLYLRDKHNKLIKIDDPRLDPVWKRCGELQMPVSIHVADPKAFWEPFNKENERWEELKDHRDWWFGDANRFPKWKDLLETLDGVVERHPETTFTCVHFGNNSEELEWLDAKLTARKNMRVDLAARIPEIGRHDPDKVRDFFIKHQDRILFGTDFQVYDRFILGSGGNEPPPSERDAEVFFEKHWRWLETRDRDWPHMTPIQGNWHISSIDLPESVLRKIYFENARKMLARSLPAPVLKAGRSEIDFPLDGNIRKPVWSKANPTCVEYGLVDGSPSPDLSTTVRCIRSPGYLYFSFDCPCTRLTTFEDTNGGKERLGLWDRDVVEVFLGTDDANPNHYLEFEVAPNNERLDVDIKLPEKDFAWSSGFESAVKVDESSHHWTAELRIPLKMLSKEPPSPGTSWRLNLFRSDRANNAFLAWNPTLERTTHVPSRFGTLGFPEEAVAGH